MKSKNIQNRNDELTESLQEMIIYQTDDGAVKIDVQMADETVWLTIDGMSKLFDKSRSTINEHILHIFEEGELKQEESVRKIGISDFSTKPTNYYNLDVIISVGYRVKSLRGTQFRQWATKRLNEYIRKGFALDDNRLKNLGGGGYWKELLDRIRESVLPKRCFTGKCLTFTPQASTMIPRPIFPLSFSSGYRTRFIMPCMGKQPQKSLSVVPMPKRNSWD